MDLRPKLAREFAEAIYESLADIDVLEVWEDEVIEKWTALIVERFKSHSIPFNWSGGDGTTRSANEGVADQFLDKYPMLRPVLEHMVEVAREMFPGCVIHYNVHSDPEGCHICHEGQDIWLDVHYDGAKTDEGKIDFDAARPLEEQYDDRVMFADDCPYAKLEGDLSSIIGVQVRPYLPETKEDDDAS